MVSVIIPNYNHAKFLNRRIDTILNQTYPNFEIIILDDYSTDNSRAIIENYRSNTRIKHIAYNQVNSGSPFIQWNKGIAFATGDYVWIAESDDYADINFISRCMEKFNENPDVALVYTDSVEVNGAGEQMGRWSRWQQLLKPNIWIDSFVAKGKLVNAQYNHIVNCIPNASSVIFKKEAYLQSPFKEKIEELKCNGDWLMWFSILEQHDVYYCHEPLSYFRYHTETTRANPESRLTNVQEQYSMLGLLKRANYLTDQELLERKLAEIYANWNLPLRDFFKADQIKTFKLAKAADKRILSRIASTIANKLK